jgi:hypothetical protein
MKKLASLTIFLVASSGCLIYSMEEGGELQTAAAAAACRAQAPVFESLRLFDLLKGAHGIARENFTEEIRGELDPERHRISALEGLVEGLRRDLLADSGRNQELREDFETEKREKAARIEALRHQLEAKKAKALEKERRVKELEAEEIARSKREEAERAYIEMVHDLNHAQGYAT